MANHFSPQNEQFLARILAEGTFTSRDTALDAAVSALREKIDAAPLIPAEHEELLAEALDSTEPSLEVTPEFWARLRQRVHDIAGARS